MRLVRTLFLALPFLPLPVWVTLPEAANRPPLPRASLTSPTSVNPDLPHASSVPHTSPLTRSTFAALIIPTTTAPIAQPATSPPKPILSPSQQLAHIDRGEYAVLASKVSLKRATWLDNELSVFVTVRDSPLAFRFVDGVAVEALTRPLTKAQSVSNLDEQDQDLDGIPDQIDGLLGAKKALLLRSPYIETYRNLPYPGGDVPLNEGVCTDVIVRALRNAGYDLQRLIHEDAQRAPKNYPGITKLDKNIDHRRVRNLLVYFKRHFTSLDASASSKPRFFLPGDIVLFNTYGDAYPDHIGIVSDTLGPSGLPLIINSWTVGYVTSEMDLLANVPVTHRFRFPNRKQH